jgi:hypothetical protein
VWVINNISSTETLCIGCESYTKEEWRNFSDEEIEAMGIQALEFWKEWKPILIQMKWL